jgi:secretion/DNA translocation related TadE-like protein
VLALGVSGVLMSLFLAAVVLSGVTTARNQAQTAADLAAVAGAQLLAQGRPEQAVCLRATRFAALNGARMTRCRLADGQAGALPEVVLDVQRPAGMGLPWLARSSARAGLVPRR